MGSDDEVPVVRFRANGWKLVDVHMVGRKCLHYEKNTGYHATSFDSATLILEDRYLRKAGGHTNGFKDAVMARKSIEDAWFSAKNHGVVFEVDFYGTLNRYETAYRIALHSGPWEGWRKRFCNQYGRHMHRRSKGDSAYYLNEDTVEITAMYVSNSEETADLLHRYRLACRNALHSV